jgi:hypothetical protein
MMATVCLALKLGLMTLLIAFSMKLLRRVALSLSSSLPQE